MGLQIYKEVKTPEELEYEIEQEIVGIHTHYFNRDKETVISIYKDIFNETRNIPRITAIEQKVAEINYDVCYRVSAIEFENCYESDAISSMLSSYNCNSTMELERYVDVSSILLSEIDYLAREMFNDICAVRTADIENFIREVLDSLDLVYEDDTDYNPLCTEILFNRDEHIILANDAQLIMFPDIHAEQYGYEQGIVYDSIQDMSIYTVRRRRTIPNSRLLKNGGD